MAPLLYVLVAKSLWSISFSPFAVRLGKPASEAVPPTFGSLGHNPHFFGDRHSHFVFHAFIFQSKSEYFLVNRLLQEFFLGRFAIVVASKNPIPPGHDCLLPKQSGSHHL